MGRLAHRGPRSPDGARADTPTRPLGTVRGAGVSWLLALLVAAAVVGLDQLTKHAVESSITPGDQHKFLPGIDLVDTRNHGIAFGFLPGSHLGVTILVGVALLALVAYFLTHATRPLIWLPTGLLIGGALGNIVDRARHGSVTDFIKLPLGWPPFNIADACITLGIVILLFVIETSRRDDP